MPDITIVKLKIRRGTDAQRKSVVLEQGELGYAIDTQRLFVGNGVILGGTVAGNIIHPPLSIPGTRVNQSNAVAGDCVYENSVLWQLTGSSFSDINGWVSISPKGDEIYIANNVNNQLTIKTKSITPDKLSDTVVYSQGGISTSANGLSANIDTTYLAISSNKITINAVNQNIIPSSALGKGLQGGSGTVLSFYGDSTIFKYNGNEVTLSALPANIVTVSNLSSNFVGNGLQIQNNALNTIVSNYDSNSFDVDVDTLRLMPIISPSSTSFSNVTYNNFGQISAVDTAVYETLSGNNTSSNTIFNGAWDQTTYTNQTLLTAVSSSPSGSTANTILTSAGYMTVDTSIGIVAVPIFKYI